VKQFQSFSLIVQNRDWSEREEGLKMEDKFLRLEKNGRERRGERGGGGRRS
jgi:hypothetical protein